MAQFKISERATTADWLAAFRQLEVAYSRNKTRRYVLQMLAEKINDRASDPGIPVYKLEDGTDEFVKK